MIYLVFDTANNSKSSSRLNPASCWTRVLLELPLVVLVGCVVALDSSSFVPAGVFWNHGQSSTGQQPCACCCRRRGASVAPYAPGYSCCCCCCCCCWVVLAQQQPHGRSTTTSKWNCCQPPKTKGKKKQHHAKLQG
jgi:hypothetical protein